MTAWLITNWPLKLVSVAAAIALWVFVAETQPTRVVLSARTEYTGIAADRVLVGLRVERVDVELEALRRVSARVSASGLRARVNVAGLPEGESVVSLSAADIDAPAGTSVTRITPDRVHVTVARTPRGGASVAPDAAARRADRFLVVRASRDRAIARIGGSRSTIVEGRGVPSTAPLGATGVRPSAVWTAGLASPAAGTPPRDRAVSVSVETRAEERMQHGDSRR